MFYRSWESTEKGGAENLKIGTKPNDFAVYAVVQDNQTLFLTCPCNGV
jgi:hypothetical protein